MENSEIKRLALLKWQAIIDNNGKDLIFIPKEIQELKHHCSYCEQFYEDDEDSCEKCPINMGFFNGCANKEHFFDIWFENQTIINARFVYGLILNTPFKDEL